MHIRIPRGVSMPFARAKRMRRQVAKSAKEDAKAEKIEEGEMCGLKMRVV